jgi:serine/threonine-protein kinase
MTAIPPSFSAAVAERYRLERELGAGGMATVYLARDLRHDRWVALKVMHAWLGAAVGSERFLREIRILAQLQHPHILSLHDSGEAGGLLYYVMPYVEGESLRDRLNREPQLPWEEALGIAREVADALAYAHRHDVVHRDIKPENILISSEPGAVETRGLALVADFGIARAVSAADGSTLTQAGVAVGTAAYMSPEQCAAEGIVDGRADTYSLGCVLYEMLAGHPPFQGSTTQAVLARHMLDPVPPLRTIRPDLSEAVERTVMKALAKAPADRFPSATGFITALTQASSPPGPTRRATRLTLWSAGGLVALMAGYALLSRSSPPAAGSSSLDSTRSIAVLAFSNVGGDSANEPFSDGIADELTTALGKIEGFSVAARTSAFSFKGRGVAAQEIGRQLGVRYVVDGAVRRAENRLRVRATLIDVASGKELWSDTFEPDAEDRDVFAIQDSLTRSIIRELQVKLSAEAHTRLAKRSTGSSQAHDLYLQGRYFFEKRDSASLRKAQDYFERAIRTDSSYALAYAGLSDAYSHSSVFGYAAPHEVFRKAKAAALQALALDDTSVEAHTSQGFISLFYDWDWSTAGRKFDRALALDSRYPPAHLFRAWFFLATGRMKDAVEEARTAVRLDPFSPVINARLATMLYFAGRYEEALAQGLRLFELEPGFFQGRVELARALVQLGRCTEALDALEQSAEHLAAVFRGSEGYAYAKCDRRAQALEELQRLDAEAKQGRYVTRYAFAVTYAGLGDAERALAELENAYAERAWAMFALKVDPAFDEIRADPRFTRLTTRLGL